LQDQTSERPDGDRLHEVLRKAMVGSRLANSRLAGQELPANGRESPAMADYGCQIDGETALDLKPLLFGVA
jgi:hypothetical protein